MFNNSVSLESKVHNNVQCQQMLIVDDKDYSYNQISNASGWNGVIQMKQQK